MTNINAVEMRTVEGGKTYTYYRCKKCKPGQLHYACASSTVTFWHVVLAHGVKLGSAWGWIETIKKNY